MSANAPSDWPAPGVRPHVGRVEPNSAVCRARDAGFGQYVDCLVSPTLMCSCGLQFGDGRLCMHPARAEIVARTQPAPPVFHSTSADGPNPDPSDSCPKA